MVCSGLRNVVGKTQLRGTVALGQFKSNDIARGKTFLNSVIVKNNIT